MVEVWNIKIDRVIIHKIGNKSRDEGMILSSRELMTSDNHDLQRVLTNFFFKQIENALFYRFTHPVDISLNEVYTIATHIFDEPEENFINYSKDICKCLYEYSDHPNIKSGELYIAYFRDCLYEDQNIDAIGIFKSESKETFLRVAEKQNGIDINYFEDGINSNKLEKGCIILNADKEQGYNVAVFDNTNSKQEAQYWKDKFLKIIARADEYHYTAEYLAAAKDFITKQIPQEYEVTKAQQADYLNKSITFFKNNDEFDEKAFVQEVFEDKELIRSFSGYKRSYEQEHEMELGDSFSISGSAVKRSARVFKSVIKLDKNFHVYVHGDRDLIERGYDEAVGKHYYKIYFDNEA